MSEGRTDSAQLDALQDGWHNLLATPGGRHLLAFVVAGYPIEEERRAMASIAIQNETEYTLTEEMAEQIRREAQEYFGETVRSIRVQYGIERHAFNARTGEVRYAFSPNDFGLVDTTTAFPDTYYHAGDLATIDDDIIEEESIPAAFEDVETDEEEPRETSLESLEADLEDDEDEEAEFPEMDDQFEDPEEEDSFMYDEDEYD